MKKNALFFLVAMMLIAVNVMQGQCSCGNKREKFCIQTKEALTILLPEPQDSASLLRFSQSLKTLQHCDSLFKFSRVFRPRRYRLKQQFQKELQEFWAEAESFRIFYERTKPLFRDTVSRNVGKWNNDSLVVSTIENDPKKFRQYMIGVDTALTKLSNWIDRKVDSGLDSTAADLKNKIRCDVNKTINTGIELERMEKFSDLYKRHLLFVQSVKGIRRKLKEF